MTEGGMWILSAALGMRFLPGFHSRKKYLQRFVLMSSSLLFYSSLVNVLSRHHSCEPIIATSRHLGFSAYHPTI